ncbi:hypothetical protein [Pelomicrobium sp.]|jgi:hypothetical protein|uniref:hypothetical protein n=1 Tax=Pelomicrobium sp. TaxID=2815319 RepID=UPI002FDEBF62
MEGPLPGRSAPHRWGRAPAFAFGALALLCSIGAAGAADPAQQAIERALLQREWQQQELRLRLQEGAGSPEVQRQRLELQRLRQSQERALTAPPPPSESEAAQEAQRALRERAFREERQRLEERPRARQQAPEAASDGGAR